MRRAPWNSVRVRLTLWNALLLAVLLSGSGIALYYRVQFDLIRTVDQNLAQGADHLATWGLFLPRGEPLPAPPGEIGGPRYAPPGRPHEGPRHRAFRSPRRGPGGPRFRPGGPPGSRDDWGRPRLLTASGEPWGPFPSDRPWDWETLRLAAAGESRYSNVEVDDEPLRVYSRPVSRNGKVEAVIQSALPLSEVERIGREQLRTLLALIPIALLAAGLVGVFMTDWTLRPVRKITHAAAQIGAADLSRRLDVTSQDEFGELAATFNGMVGRLEEAFTRLESAYQQMEAAYEQQRRFTADASHELRTPLTRIKGSASLALSTPRSAEEYRKALQMVNQAADVMNGLIQDLLLLARADAGQSMVDPQPVTITALFQRAAAAIPETTGRSLRLQIPDPPLVVRGHADSLVRLLTNLIENALRHTPPEGEVTLSAREEGGNVVISVADTGEGIPPEHLPHVAERFYRVDAARSRAEGGAGLGLSICQSIAQAHGGKLEIESEVGMGTTVRVIIPRVDSVA